MRFGHLDRVCLRSLAFSILASKIGYLNGLSFTVYAGFSLFFIFD